MIIFKIVKFKKNKILILILFDNSLIILWFYYRNRIIKKI